MIDGLPGGLLVAAGLIVAGAGMLLRSVPAGRAGRAAVAASLAVVLGGGAVGAGVTDASVDGVNAALPPDGASGAGTERSRTITEPVGAVLVDLRAGDVQVRETSGRRVQLTTTTYGDRVTVTDRVEGDRLVVDGRCSGGWLPWLDDRCRVDVDLRVPTGTDVTVDQGAGSMQLTELTGATRIETGAAEVRLDRLDGPLRVSTGAGAITATGLTSAEGTFDTGAGDIDVVWTRRPTTVDISTGVGEVDVVVPQGAYRYDVDTGVGSATTEGITRDAAADARIDVYTGAGSATVRGR